MDKHDQLRKYGYWIEGGKQYTICGGCGKVIRLNKPLFGSLHFCATDEESTKDNN